MGTNHYWHEKPPCPTCGHQTDGLHIGKSSGGWAFSLHVIPEDGIATLWDWQRKWAEPGSEIRNEYGDLISEEEMLAVVTVRARPDPINWTAEKLRQNHAWADPGSNLLRHVVDGSHCVGNGPGTYDFITGEFS